MLVTKGEQIVVVEGGGHAAVSATHVRSTVLCSSILALRARGLFDRYFEALEPPFRDEALSLPAGIWVPVDFALAHYDACQHLDLDPYVIDEIGAEVGDRISKSLLSVIVTLSREVGVSPWSVLTRANKLRDVAWKGSALGVWRLGPKDARVEWAGQPCARSRYFGLAFGGFMRGLCQLFCRRAFVRLLPGGTATSLNYRVFWA